jgi:hypothetical protein
MKKNFNEKFSFISEIMPEKEKTWKNKIFLTFDMDWCHDDIIVDTYNLILKHKIKSSWFVTHDTKLLKKFKNDPLIELGIHPNFNNLLMNSEKEKNHEDILSELLDKVPNARIVRSHSLLQSEKLLDSFYKFKISHISNFYVPYASGFEVKPYKLWDNLIITPHRWQDNVEIKMNSNLNLFNKIDNGLNIFNFHPIHIFLNSKNLERYNKNRDIIHNPKKLIRHRFKRYGIRNFLQDLLEKNKLNAL